MMGAPSHYNSKELQFKKKGQQIIKGTRNKQTGMWEVTLDTQKSKIVVNNILDQTTKLELAQYLHITLLRPTEKNHPQGNQYRFTQ